MMGRHSSYSQEVADEIVERISTGETMRAICREEGKPHWTTVYEWMDANEDFALRIARAREMGAEAIAQEALAIADTPIEGVERTEKDDGRVETRRGDMLGHRKLQIETRLKLLAKWDPKRYGDKVTQEHTGPGGGPIKQETTISMTPEEAYKRMLGG